MSQTFYRHRPAPEKIPPKQTGNRLGPPPRSPSVAGVSVAAERCLAFVSVLFLPFLLNFWTLSPSCIYRPGAHGCIFPYASFGLGLSYWREK